MSLMHMALVHHSGQFHLQRKAAGFVELLKNLSCKVQCHKFPKSVNASGLFMLLLLTSDVAVNHGPTMGAINV